MAAVFQGGVVLAADSRTSTGWFSISKSESSGESGLVQWDGWSMLWYPR